MTAGNPAGRRRGLLRALEALIFARRRATLALLTVITLLLAWPASQLPVDAAFDRLQPARHPFSEVERRHRDVLDGANPVRIAVLRKSGDIYDPVHLARLKALTEGIARLPGIDRRHLRSLFTPEVRYIDVIEGRYFGASVIADDFDPEHATRAQLARLRSNIARAGIIGRFVSADRRGVLIEAAWQARDPASGRPFDQRQLMRGLDDVIGAAMAAGDGDISVHVIGAPALAEALVAELPAVAVTGAAGLAGSALLLVVLLGSLRVAAISLACLPVIAIWQLGLLRLAGRTLDPDAVWALAVTATVALITTAQFGLRWLRLAAEGERSGFEASLHGWRQLAGPSSAALVIAAAATGLLAVSSEVPLSRQLALVSAIGLVAILPIALVAMPAVLSGTGTRRLGRRLAERLDARLAALSALSRPRPGRAVLVVLGVLGGVSAWQLSRQPVEPAGADLARLSPDNPARSDGDRLAAAFPRNVREFRVIVEAANDACTDAEAMEQVDRLVWQLENLPHVTGSTALPQTLKRVLTAFADGSPKFRVLARNRETLTQAMAPISADSGLHAKDCTVLPLSLYLDRRDAATLAAVAAEVERFNAANADEFFEVHREVDAAYCREQRRLRTPAGERPDALTRACPIQAVPAGGPLGASLARQAALADFLGPATLLVLAALVAGVWLLLGDLLAALVVLLPLAFAGWIGMGLMSASGVALTWLTGPLWLSCLAAGLGGHLPMVRELRESLQTGRPLMTALHEALAVHGRALLAALVMAAGFALWTACGYPAQRGVGQLLVIGWTMIALSGLLVLPAFASLLVARTPQPPSSPVS